jgi:ABC-type lipoprotein export system ATPase subunit
MDIFNDQYRNHGDTILVSKHDSIVARSADRIIYHLDGKVVRDDFVIDPSPRDLREFSTSRFGQAIQKGEIHLSIREFGLETHMGVLREIPEVV